MKLSIITVNLNNREGLQRTIDSVIGQTFRDFEWIVIDGASTDGSKELIEKHSDYFAYWVSESDTGVYNAMNKGIRVAKGEYCLFLNSGDWLWDSMTLDKVFCENNLADIVYGNVADFKDGTFIKLKTYPLNLGISFLLTNALGHQSTFIKTSLFQNELYDESLRIVSDWKFCLRKALQGTSFQYLNTTVSSIDLNGISYTHRELLNEEKKLVIQQEVSHCILNDFYELDSYRKKPVDPQMQILDQYRKQRRLYHKFTTALLIFINLLEKGGAFFNKHPHQPTHQ